MNRYRILLILPSFDSGGAENYALRLINFAGHERYEWHVTSGNLQNAQLRPAFLAAGAKVHSRTTGYLNPRKAFRFWRFVRQNSFDAVVSFNGIFSANAMLISWLNRVPSRITWHRCSRPAHSPSLGRSVYQSVAQKIIEYCSTRILSNSKSALDYFHPRRSQSTHLFQIIPNGIDPKFTYSKNDELSVSLRKKLGIPEDARVIGHIGRFTPAKDHETLLMVVQRLVQNDPKIRLLVAGTDTDSAAFSKLVSSYSLSSSADCLGPLDNVSELYRIMDVFLFPSVTEGQSNALIEAMVTGVPIAASDILPNRETIPPELERNLFTPRDVDVATNIVLRLLQVSSLEQTRSISLWAQDHYDASRNFGRAIEAIIPVRPKRMIEI